jgi:hypothetical protein
MSETVQDLSWMARFTNPDAPDRVMFCRQPLSIEYESETWAMATNGITIVMVKGANDFPRISEEMALKVLPIIRPAKMPTRLGSCEIARLAEWCGDPDWGVEIECPSCGESFLTGDNPRRGLLGNIQINKNLLSKPLEYLQGDAEVFGKKDNQIILIGDGWRLHLATLNTKELAREGDLLDPSEAFVLEPAK